MTGDMTAPRMMSPQMTMKNDSKQQFKFDYDLFSDDDRFDKQAKLTHRRTYKKTMNLESQPDEKQEERQLGLRSGRKMRKNQEGQMVSEFTEASNMKTIM